MFLIKIAKDQTTINEIIHLRYTILREPWNKPKETATDELELSSVNAYIEEAGKIVACGRLQDNGDGIGQIRYMAVNENFQGQGLGKLILRKLEEEARTMKLDTIELQARENALMFYKTNGYTVVEKSFCLWDIIQHYLMEKTLKQDFTKK